MSTHSSTVADALVDRSDGAGAPRGGSTLEAVLGLDIGTTTSKALIRRRDGAASDVVVEAPTPWTATSDGAGPEIGAETLVELSVRLVTEAAEAAELAWGQIAIRAVSVTGFAESGILLDPAGRSAQPVIAWFDSRGSRELPQLAEEHPEFAAAFPAVTGLPYSAQSSFAKLLWLDRQAASRSSRHQPLAGGARWLSVPEWIVFALGGDQVREPSLASRTGLIEQRTGQPWETALDLIRARRDLLPPAASVGSAVGKLTHPAVPACAKGAALSLAGHDHPVAALAANAVGVDELFNSAGTADVLARAVVAPLSDEQRAAIVAAGWSAGAHVVPGVDLLLAGGGGGLLLRRVLAGLGADTADARQRLDAASMELTQLPAGLVVQGDGRHSDDVEIRLRDNATPAAIWRAAAAYTSELAHDMLADIEVVVGPHGRAVAAGGWTRMASIRAAKAAAIPALEFSDLTQPGATGAAVVAEYSLSETSRQLSDYLASTRLESVPTAKGCQ